MYKLAQSGSCRIAAFGFQGDIAGTGSSDRSYTGVKGTCIGPSGSYYSSAIACTGQRDCGINLFLTVETVKATKAHTC